VGSSTPAPMNAPRRIRQAIHKPQLTFGLPPSYPSPPSSLLHDRVSSWEREQPATTDAEKIVRSFVSGFYGVVDEHRELIRTLISARAQGGDHELDKVSTAVSDKFAEGLRIMRRALLDHGEPRHYDRLDPPLTVAVSAGAVMSALLLDDWLSRAESAGRAGSGRSTNSSRCCCTGSRTAGDSTVGQSSLRCQAAGPVADAAPGMRSGAGVEIAADWRL
jgi:hypothetical protein